MKQSSCKGCAPMHLHPRITETFTVMTGHARYQQQSKEYSAQPDERIVIYFGSGSQYWPRVFLFPGKVRAGPLAMLREHKRLGIASNPTLKV